MLARDDPLCSGMCGACGPHTEPRERAAVTVERSAEELARLVPEQREVRRYGQVRHAPRPTGYTYRCSRRQTRHTAQAQQPITTKNTIASAPVGPSPISAPTATTASTIAP